MRVAIGIGAWGGDWMREARNLRDAERLGGAGAWSSEAWGFDAFTPIAYLAARTERLLLGTGIAQVGTRTPAVLAMTALTLASLANGRFLLGLGVSGPPVIEGLHGVPFERTLTRLRETTAIMRMATRGERLVFEGERYRLPLLGGEGKALRLAAPPRPVSISFATLGPRALEAAGSWPMAGSPTPFSPAAARSSSKPPAAGRSARDARSRDSTSKPGVFSASPTMSHG